MRCPRLSNALKVSGPSFGVVHASGNPLNNARNVAGVRSRIAKALTRSNVAWVIIGTQYTRASDEQKLSGGVGLPLDETRVTAYPPTFTLPAARCESAAMFWKQLEIR